MNILSSRLMWGCAVLVLTLFTFTHPAFAASKLNQTITFGPLASKTYGDASFTVSATASSSLTVTFSSNTPTTCSVTGSGHTISVDAAGTCSIKASQSGNFSYNAAPDVTQSFTIAKKNLTVTGITALSKTYDATTTATLNTSSATLVGKVSGDAVTLATSSAVGTFADKNSGTGKVVTISGLTISGSKSTNYTLSQPTTTADILAGAATVSVTDPTQLAAVYDGTPKTVGFTTVPSGLTLVVTYDGTTTAPVDAGSHAVLASINDASYAGSTSTTLVIAKADQSITFGSLADKHSNDADSALSATASSSLPVTFTATGTCAIIASTTVHLTGAGTCAVTAHQAGNSNYNAAHDVTQSFAVTDVPAPAVVPPVTGNTSSGQSAPGGSNGPIAGSMFGATAPLPGGSNPAPTTPAPHTGTVLGAETYHFGTNLKRGMHGQDVTELQKFLSNASFYSYPTFTGYFGSVTFTAVKAFQKANALPVTGYVGPLTRAILNQ